MSNELHAVSDLIFFTACLCLDERTILFHAPLQRKPIRASKTITRNETTLLPLCVYACWCCANAHTVIPHDTMVAALSFNTIIIIISQLVSRLRFRPTMHWSDGNVSPSRVIQNRNIEGPYPWTCMYSRVSCQRRFPAHCSCGNLARFPNIDTCKSWLY